MSALLGGEVPLDRAVAVVAELPDGRFRWGSGFLLSSTRVLTAWHCTVDSPASARALGPQRLSVFRRGPNGWEQAPATRLAYSVSHTGGPYEWGLDVAVLGVERPPWRTSEWSAPSFARVDRTRSGELVGCVAVGYPLYMLAPRSHDDITRKRAPWTTSEVRGFVRQGEGDGSGYLALADDGHSQVRVPPGVGAGQTSAESPWGGLSGAAVFHRGHLIGHVVQHRPHLGPGTVLVVPTAGLAQAMSEGARAVAGMLALPPLDALPIALGADRTVWSEALDSRSLGPDGLPRTVGDVDDLRVFGVRVAGADAELLADLGYVPRPVVDAALDRALRAAVDTGRMVLVVGDSASGKSRSAAEAVRRDPALRRRPLIVPDAERVGVARLLDAGVPIADGLVWLDDLHAHLGQGLGANHLRRLSALPSALCVATIARQRLAALQAAGGRVWELLADESLVRRVDVPSPLTPEEQREVAGRVAAPSLLAGLHNGIGLGEWLIAGPRLMERLDLSSAPERALADAVIGWARTGLRRPLPRGDLVQLWLGYLPAADRDTLLELDEVGRAEELEAAVQWLCGAVAGRALHEQRLAYRYPDGFLADDYVVDRVARTPGRFSISEQTWRLAVDRAQALAAAGAGGVEAYFGIAMAAVHEDAFEPACLALGMLHGIDYPMAGAMLAMVLRRHGLAREAVEVCTEVVRRCGDSTDLLDRRSVAAALNVESDCLLELGDLTGVVAVGDDVLARFADDSSDDLREQVAKSMYSRALVLRDAGRRPESRRFGEDPAAEFVEVRSKVDELGAEIDRLSPEHDRTPPGGGAVGHVVDGHAGAVEEAE